MATEQKLLGSLVLGLDPIKDENRKGYFPKTSRYAWNGLKGAKKFLTDGKTNDENDASYKPFRNLFLFRNRPHAQQVRHIKGLLDVPICVVLGNNFQTFDKMRSSSHLGTFERGLVKKFPQPKFKLDMSAKMWKAIPEMGLVSLQPKWLTELEKMTDATGLKDAKKSKKIRVAPKAIKAAEEDFVRKAVSQSGQRVTLSQSGDREILSQSGQRAILSQSGQRLEEDKLPPIDQTGRLMTAPQSGSRQTRRVPSVKQTLSNQDMIFPDTETFVFHLLAQILETDSAEAVKMWLWRSPEEEKRVILNMLIALSQQYGDTKDQPSSITVPPASPKIEVLESGKDGDVGVKPQTAEQALDEAREILSSSRGRSNRMDLDQIVNSAIENVRIKTSQAGQKPAIKPSSPTKEKEKQLVIKFPDNEPPNDVVLQSLNDHYFL